MEKRVGVLNIPHIGETATASNVEACRTEPDEFVFRHNRYICMLTEQKKHGIGLKVDYIREVTTRDTISTKQDIEDGYNTLKTVLGSTKHMPGAVFPPPATGEGSHAWHMKLCAKQLASRSTKNYDVIDHVTDGHSTDSAKEMVHDVMLLEGCAITPGVSVPLDEGVERDVITTLHNNNIYRISNRAVQMGAMASLKCTTYMEHMEPVLDVELAKVLAAVTAFERERLTEWFRSPDTCVIGKLVRYLKEKGIHIDAKNIKGDADMAYLGFAAIAVGHQEEGAIDDILDIIKTEKKSQKKRIGAILGGNMLSTAGDTVTDAAKTLCQIDEFKYVTASAVGMSRECPLECIKKVLNGILTMIGNPLNMPMADIVGNMTPANLLAYISPLLIHTHGVPRLAEELPETEQFQSLVLAFLEATSRLSLLDPDRKCLIFYRVFSCLPPPRESDY